MLHDMDYTFPKTFAPDVDKIVERIIDVVGYEDRDYTLVDWLNMNLWRCDPPSDGDNALMNAISNLPFKDPMRFAASLSQYPYTWCTSYCNSLNEPVLERDTPPHYESFEGCTPKEIMQRCFYRCATPKNRDASSIENMLNPHKHWDFHTHLRSPYVVEYYFFWYCVAKEAFFLQRGAEEPVYRIKRPAFIGPIYDSTLAGKGFITAKTMVKLEEEDGIPESDDDDASHVSGSDDEKSVILVEESDADEKEAEGDDRRRVKRRRLAYNKPPLLKDTVFQRIEYLKKRVDRFKPIKERKFDAIGNLMVDIKHMKMYEEMKEAEEEVKEAVKAALDTLKEAFDKKVRTIKRMLRGGMFASKTEAIHYIEETYGHLALDMAYERRKAIGEPMIDRLVESVSNDEIMRSREQVFKAVRECIDHSYPMNFA